MSRALTPDEIFEAMAAELERLGLSCMLLPFDESCEHLRTSYVSVNSKVLRAVE